MHAPPSTRPTPAVSLAFAAALCVASMPAAAQEAETTDECPVTIPSEHPKPAVTRNEGNATHAWFGSARLAALIPRDGIWIGMGAEHNYRDKFWWWRSGYNAFLEPQPDLVVTATRLDASGPDVRMDNATNAFGGGWQSMLIGMEFPRTGCWEVTGTYKGTEQVRFVVLVADREAPQ